MMISSFQLYIAITLCRCRKTETIACMDPRRTGKNGEGKTEGHGKRKARDTEKTRIRSSQASGGRGARGA